MTIDDTEIYSSGEYRSVTRVVSLADMPLGASEALLSQLEKAGCMDRAELPFQQAIINEELPYTIGGGIGQSRICMFFLRKAHIGEVQCSMWPDSIMKEAEEIGLQLL